MVVRRMVAGAVAVGCLVLAVGCASQGDDSSAEVPASGMGRSGPASADVSADAPVSPTFAEMAGDQVSDEGSSGAPPGPGAIDAASVAVGRSIVSTAMVTVESDNVVEARQRTVAIVESAGGAIYDEQTELGDQGRTTITLRVPPAQFQSVLTQLGQVGELTTQDISTEDVTAQVVDLDARIASAEVSVERLRGFLGQATSVTEIAELERELVSRETNLETLRGQKRTLDGRIDLATIVLTVAPPVSAPSPDEARPLPGFLDGLTAGWDTLVSTLTVVGAMAGWVLPFVPLLVALGLAVRWYRGRRPARPASEVGSVNLPPPPQPAT